ncbi:MAG: copper chaperone PCu(A)C [Gemmatimonas sp.]
MMRRWSALCVFAVIACADGAPVPLIEIREAWARPADSAATTAAYFVIANHDTTTISLTAQSSPWAESVALHETMLMGDMVHMTPVSAPMAIAPGDSLVLKEGAKHLMVSALARPLVAGDSLPVVLTFGDGRTVRVSVLVRSP